MVNIEELRTNYIYQGDALQILKVLPSECVDCIVTSPPYWALRDYGVEGQLGLEPTVGEYIEKLCAIFDEVRRVLKPTGTCWVNVGDTYSSTRWTNSPSTTGISGRHCDVVVRKETSLKDKCLVQVPSRFALEMCDRGWILRNEIIWHKPNCMPASVTDRFTVDFEKLFFFTKDKNYYFDQQHEPIVSAEDRRVDTGRVEYRGKYDTGNRPCHWGHKAFVTIKSAGRNKRCVWAVPTRPFPNAHFAVYPERLIETPIRAGCPPGGVVLDPFMGSGTTALVALKQRKRFIGIELNPEYIAIASRRVQPLVAQRTLNHLEVA